MKLIGMAVLFAIIAQIVHTIGATATMDYYTDPLYFPLWSEVMMPAFGPPGMEFYAVSIASNFVIGLILAAVFVVLKNSIPGSGSRKGINYGILLFLVSAVPSAMSSYLILSVPAALLAAWAIENLLIFLVGGAVFARILR